MPSEFMAMVQRLEGRFTQEASTSRGGLPIPGQASSILVGEEAEDPCPTAEPKIEPEANLRMPPEFAAVLSLLPPANGAIPCSRPIHHEIEIDPKSRAVEVEPGPAPPSAPIEGVSAGPQQLQADAVAEFRRKLDDEKQRFVAETQQQFEELRASGQAFVADAQKQLAATMQSSLDSLIDATIEKVRAELDASKHNLIEESQKLLASMSRPSLEPLTKDLIEQVRTKLVASRPVFIEDTQTELAKMTRFSLQYLQTLGKACLEQVNADLMDSRKTFIDKTQRELEMTQALLESMLKSTIEQGRRELSFMVNEFFSSSMPQIEAELKTLMNRHSEDLQTITRTRTNARLAPLPPPLPEHRPESTSAETVPKHQNNVPHIWARIAWGVSLGLVLGVLVLAMLAIYVSSSPVVRLQAEPPAAFFDENPHWNAKQRVREDKLALAYWDVAVRDIETKYGFGTTLPTDPPDSFKVEEKGQTGTTLRVDSAARARYWEKLREVWPRPDSWERISDWNLDWIHNH
jgi:hypothetical protein